MNRARQAVLPGYLLLCLLLGGSTQAIWGNAVLQWLAVAILGWAALTRDPQPLTRQGKQLLLIVGALGLLFTAQLVPLPPALWTRIPGRQFIADGFGQLGMALPWMPISQAPYDTLATAITLLPPLALLIGMLRLRDWDSRAIFGAIAVGAMISVLLGLLQLTGSDGAWYFYRVTNLGVAVGTFANGNHFATLLLVAIPGLAALVAIGLRSENKQRRSLAGALALGLGAALAIGAIMNSSAAFLLLWLPVTAAAVMLAMRLSPARMRQGVLAIALILMIAAASLAILGNRFPGWGTNASFETRMSFWDRTLEATKTEGLLGSGFGTFQSVYGRYEEPAEVDRFYVNHAHGDYFEIALEGGIPALVLLLVFFAWWTGRARDAWLAPAATVEQKAAAVASAAILLHSLFDYPLRTAAIMAVMAACLAFLGGARGRPRGEGSENVKPARHATL